MSIKSQVLAYVEANPGCTATAIARALGQKSSTVSAILNKESGWEDSFPLFRTESAVTGKGRRYYSRPSEKPVYSTRFERVRRSE